jgi:Flp pilus assembly protein TadG
MIRLLRSQSGQATVEFAGAIWMVLLAGLAAWQLALAGWSAVGAANAARTAARAYSRVGDEVQAAKDAHQSLQGDGLAAGSNVTISGGTATVVVKIPLVFPGIASPIPITETADMPYTG